MNNKIFLLPFLTILLSMFAVADVPTGSPAFPHPVYGHIMAGTNSVLNADVEVYNYNTRILSEGTTNKEGFFMVDLGNSDPTYRDGDKLKVTLVYCKSLPICNKEIFVSGGGNEVSWNIESESITIPLPTEITIVKYVCWDGSTADVPSSCPAQPVPEPIIQQEIVEVITIKCADGTLVESADECPEKTDSFWSYIIGVIIAVGFGAIGGGGWKFYNGKFKHYHRGIVGYHDPNTIHTNPSYKHKRWKDSPLGCMSDVKKIQQGIKL